MKKILFQGGWKAGRNPDDTKSLITSYCKALARNVVANNHCIVLASPRDFDSVVAQEVVAAASANGRSVKDHLTYLLPEREQVVPEQGRVIRIPPKSGWLEERTYCIRQTDALIAIGGGKGTFDCVEKAFLARKPVFVAAAVPSRAAEAWRNRSHDYKYTTPGDTQAFDDLNVSPDEFFAKMFRILDSVDESAFSRRVFVVHGHDLAMRDALADILRKLQFEVVILQEEANRSLTVIEKLERDTSSIGFAFVLYGPDDTGRLQGATEKPRARQNVVFEHGLLIGLLGRKRTCAVIKGNIEVPSDIKGMLYQEVSDLRDEALAIARILKDAGYKVDASRLI